MSPYRSRLDFLKKNPKVRAFAALAKATEDQENIIKHAEKMTPGKLKGKEVVIIGSGVGGLTTAYELLAQKSGAKVTVLEALNRTGGRCLSLRTGDTLVEDQDSQLFDSKPGEPQVVRFKRPKGDAEPYLNAGPGRIPSSHKRLLSYLKKFSVEIEVYVMNSESNLVQKDCSFDGEPMVYRRLNHNTRGWIAQMVYANAEALLKAEGIEYQATLEEYAEDLKELMVDFGELDENGKFVVSAGNEGFEDGKSRSGYEVLPGVDVGKIARKLKLPELLNSKFWQGTRFYQPSDFLWQPTLFQPVGGMDQVQHAFAQQVAALGGNIHLNHPVKTIDWDESKQKFRIEVSQVGTEETIPYEADYCICNLAMPFLKRILSDKLLPPEYKNTDTSDRELAEDTEISIKNQGLSEEFKRALHAVFVGQFDPEKAPGFDPEEAEGSDGFVSRFLANTTKVGWQADRKLWQGSPIREDNLQVEDSEVGVVPIFGGISWTDNEIQQIWYPSTAYQDQKGVLTGAYNFGEIAHRWGTWPVEKRLEHARNDARKFGKAFGDGLQDGLAIAWQNMPHIKGGWAYWQAVGDADYATDQFNAIAQGSGVTDPETGKTGDANFFVVGDQISSLPGWQEGAIASAINAVSRMAEPGKAIKKLASLPDPRLMVEGV